MCKQSCLALWPVGCRRLDAGTESDEQNAVDSCSHGHLQLKADKVRVPKESPALILHGFDEDSVGLGVKRGPSEGCQARWL